MRKRIILILMALILVSAVACKNKDNDAEECIAENTETSTDTAEITTAKPQSQNYIRIQDIIKLPLDTKKIAFVNEYEDKSEYSDYDLCVTLEAPLSTDDLNAISKLTELTHFVFLDWGTDLEYLDLEGCECIEDYSALSDMISLKYLCLGSNSNFSDVSVLTPLYNLEDLGIYNTAVTDYTPLYSMKNLKFIGFNRFEELDRDKIKELRKNLPDCEVHDW